MSQEIAVNVATGELLEDLDKQPPEVLAEAFAYGQRLQTGLKSGMAAIEAELRQRMRTLDRELVVFGDWEVEAKFDNRREWDPDELETVLEELRDSGVIRAAEGAGIIETTKSVKGTAALALRSRLGHDAQHAIDTTFTWTRKRRALRVVPSVSLEGAIVGALPANTGEPPQAPITDLEELFND
jgi:hypothetical protein